MNNKGQTLVLFVILIPVFLGLFAFCFDNIYMSIEKNKLLDIAEIANDYKNSKTNDEIKDLILKNDKDIKKINIRNKIILEKEIDSIFGKIIGLDTYKIKVTY